MKTIANNICIRVLLCLGIILLNVPQQAHAALFTREASAAVLAKDAEASEFAVMPSAQPGTSLMGFGTGVASFGQELAVKMRTLLEEKLTVQDSSVILEEVPVVAPPVAAGVVVEPIELAAPTSGAVLVTPIDAAPAVAVEEVVPASAQTAASEREDEEKALFPLLWKGHAGVAAGALAGGGTESVVSSRAVAIGVIIALIAAGIAIPLAFSSGGGGGSTPDGGSGQGGTTSKPPVITTTTTTDNTTPNTTPVPEPATMLLFGLGLLGLFSRKKIK